MLTKLGQLRKRNLFLLSEGRELLAGHILGHISTKGRPELKEVRDVVREIEREGQKKSQRSGYGLSNVKKCIFS